MTNNSYDIRIAYIILTCDNPIHLNRMIASLNSPNVSFFIHVDEKSDISSYSIPELDNIFIIKNRIKVYWGEFSQVQAIINLLRMAVTKDNYDYYIFLSGTDYPVRNNNYIFNYLIRNRGKEFINIVKMPGVGKTFKRIWYYRFQNANKTYSPKSLIKLMLNFVIKNLRIKRKFPERYSNLVFYGGSAKWALTGECIKYILDYIKNNPELVKYWRNTLMPDETFIHTIIGNSKFYNNIECNFSYEDWSIGDTPAFLTMKHTRMLARNEYETPYGKSQIIFARKFTDNSTDLIEYIDRHLRK